MDCRGLPSVSTTIQLLAKTADTTEASDTRAQTTRLAPKFHSGSSHAGSSTLEFHAALEGRPPTPLCLKNKLRLFPLQHLPHQDLWPPGSPACTCLSALSGLLRQPPNFSHPTCQFPASDSFCSSPPALGCWRSPIPASLPKPSALLSTYLTLPCGLVCYCLLIPFTSFS